MSDMDMQEANRLAREDRNAYNRKWYAEHKEERNAYLQKWKAEHKEECKAYRRKSRQKNRERYNATQKAWRAANPDKVAEIMRRYWTKKALELLNESGKERGAEE